VNNDELKAFFDQHASGYDKQWLRMAPVSDGLHFLLESVFAELPSEARILCVGVGTGKELIHLAKKFPEWCFTAVEPSSAMLDVCRQRVEEEGISSRCYFHGGYLDSLPTADLYEGATCFLVSQFILEKEARSEFFQQIRHRLKPDGILASADLAADVGSENYDAFLRVWQRVMAAADASPEGLARIKAAYAKNVAVLPPASVASIIKGGGFEAPVQFFQAGLIHAWFARCASNNIA
jgi:tRNA (cmo5U34)-methyltransferase